MSKRNQKILRRAPQENNSSLISVDDISGLEKFHKKPGTRETNKENVGQIESNKEEFTKPKQVKKPAAIKELNEKVPDITSTPFQGSHTVPLTNVFQEKMSPIARVSGKFVRAQTKIPVLKSKLPTFVPQSVLQSATIPVQEKKISTQPPQRSATAPSMVPAASLLNQCIVKGKTCGEVKTTVKCTTKQGAQHDEKKSGDVKQLEEMQKYGGGDAKPAEKASKKNVGDVDQEEQNGAKKDDKLLNKEEKSVHELNKTRVLVPASGSEGVGPSFKPEPTTKSTSSAVAAQKDLLPVNEVTFVKKCKEVKAVNKKNTASKMVTDSIKTLNTEAETKLKNVAKTKAKETNVGSERIDSDLVQTNSNEQECGAVNCASKETQETVQYEIKETEEVEEIKVNENPVKISNKENLKSEINKRSKNHKLTKNNKVCKGPIKENETNPSTKEIKLIDAAVEVLKASGTILTSKTEDCKIGEPILSSKHNSVQITDIANEEHNLVNTEAPVPSDNEDLDGLCDWELKIRKALCQEKKTKRRSKQKEDSKLHELSTEEELMLSLQVDLFSPNGKSKHLISDSQKPVTSVPSKRKAKPDGNASSKRGKKNVVPGVRETSPLKTENSGKLQEPEDELTNTTKLTTTSKRQIKQKLCSKTNDDKNNQDEIPGNSKRKSRKQMVVEKSIDPDKPGKDDGPNTDPTQIESKLEPQKKRRTTTTKKQTKTAAKGQKCEEGKMDCTSEYKNKTEVIQSVEGKELKEDTNVEASVKTKNIGQGEHMSDNKHRKKRKVESLTELKPDCSVKVTGENVNSEILKSKRENPEKEHEQELLSEDASLKKRRTKTLKKQTDAVVECNEQEKISETCTAEQEQSKRSRASRKTKKIVDTEAQGRNHQTQNLNLQPTDVCSLAMKLTKGSNERNDIPKNDIFIKTTELKEHNHLEIKENVSVSLENGQTHRKKMNKANGEVREECINGNRIIKKRKIKEVEEDKYDSHEKKHSEITGPSSSDNHVGETERLVAKRLEVEKDSSDDRSQPVGTNYSKLSDQHGERSRSSENRSGFKRLLNKWFFSGEPDFKHKDSEESGVMYAKCISINNTVAAGYIHIESGKTFSGVATNNTVYLVQKGNVEVTLGGETQSLKRSQFFLIIPGVPFSVENKSTTSSVHLSYVKFRSLE